MDLNLLKSITDVGVKLMLFVLIIMVNQHINKLQNEIHLLKKSVEINESNFKMLNYKITKGIKDGRC